MLEVRRVPAAGLSRQLTLFMIRHGESEWNSAQKHHNIYAQLKQVHRRNTMHSPRDGRFNMK
eukprot:SAG31_NODE_4789_length_2955_cov_1.493347_2_plen_62_part_00